jgi:hypothetical protein
VDAMHAVEFGPRGHSILLVGRVDHEQHGGLP